MNGCEVNLEFRMAWLRRTGNGSRPEAEGCKAGSKGHLDHYLFAGASGGMAYRSGKIPPKHQLFTASEYRKNMLILCDIIVNQ